MTTERLLHLAVLAISLLSLWYCRRSFLRIRRRARRLAIRRGLERLHQRLNEEA